MSSGQNILVVDDEDLTRMMIRRVLEDQGFNVLEASNGQIGLDVCRQQAIDLILMDVRMPVLNGFDTCRSLRAQAHTAFVPVLMLTALDDPVSVSNAFDAGATDFVTKPINWSLLAQRIHYALRTHRTEMALRQQRDMLEQAQSLANMGTWHYEPKTKRVFLDPALCTVTRSHKNDFSALEILRWVHINDRQRLLNYLRCLTPHSEVAGPEIRIQHPGQPLQHLAICAMAASADQPDKTVLGMAQDISARIEAQAQLNYQANFDLQTGLPNRDLFTIRLEAAILAAQTSGARLAVFHIGLDVTQKAQAGVQSHQRDALWKCACQKLQDLVQNKGLLARIDTNTFAILVDDVTSLHAVTELARQISKLFAYPLEFLGSALLVDSVCGIAVYPEDGTQTSTLQMNAATAMARAMQHTSLHYQFYTPALQEQVQKLYGTEVALFHALERGEFELHYQPKVNMRTMRTTGVEALLRWNRPGQGMQPPDTFIPVLEQTGLILPVGQWVIQRACTELASTGVKVAVNLSPRQLGQPHLAKLVAQILSEQGMPANLLELEITEQSLTQAEEDALACLAELSQVGLTTALDDYGTGYSSLQRLKQMPLNTLKIDKSFVRHLLQDRFDHAVVSSTIALAHELGLEVVAEGVEDEGTLLALSRMGCDCAQGYFIAKPMRLVDLKNWLLQGPYPA